MQKLNIMNKHNEDEDSRWGGGGGGMEICHSTRMAMIGRIQIFNLDVNSILYIQPTCIKLSPFLQMYQLQELTLNSTNFIGISI